MKKLLLLLLICPITTWAQTSFTDDFESYTSTDYIGAQSQWRTWAGTPMGADDIQVGQTQDINAANTNALHFSSTVTTGGPSDILFELGGPYNTGQMSIQFDIKTAAGKDGYLNFQGANATGTFHSNVFFRANGDLEVTAGPGGEILSGSYNNGSWNTIRFEANLNSNAWELFVNNVSQGEYQAETYAIAMINFYPTSNASDFWIDNISYNYTPFTSPTRNGAIAVLGIENGLATQQREVEITIRNLGTTPITSFDIDVTTGGTPLNQSVTNVNIAPNADYSFVMNSQVILTSGLNSFTGTIKNVNGTLLDDATFDDSKSIQLTPVTPADDKFVIGEEATGTWCGWCPRGDVALKTMEEKYPGFFQGIAVHNGDPMAVAVYDQGMNTKISGYPSALVDRQADIDPGAFETDFLQRVTVAPNAKITNGATYDANTGLLEVSLNVDFLQAVSGNYKIACVIVEDSVTGTASGYNQSNYYAGGSNGVMGGYESLPGTVPAAQMVYKHVARFIAPNFTGIPNAFPVSVTQGASYVHNFRFNISGLNKDKIHIVGMILSPNGQVDNGSSSTIPEAVAAGFVVSTKDISYVPDLINVYPNPANDKLNILVQDIKNGGITELQVLDMSGKLIMTQNVDLIQGANRSTLNIAELAAGTYVLKLNNEKGGAYTTTFSKK